MMPGYLVPLSAPPARHISPIASSQTGHPPKSQATSFHKASTMTRIVRKNNIRSQDGTTYPPSSDSPDSKTPNDTAMLAQRLGSESSWADRYVPSTPNQSVMTPDSSIADHSERTLDDDFMTADEEPPSYEEVTSSSASTHSQSHPRNLPPTFHSQPPQRPLLPGRRYSQHETYQSINGTYTLGDSLNLTTTSGSINIKLDVTPGPDPARLNLKTSSGSITVNDKQCDTAMSHPSPFGARSGNTGGGLLSFLWGSRNTPTQTETPPIPTTDDPRKQPGQHLQSTDQPASTTPPARVILTTIETSSGSVNGHLLVTASSNLAITTNSGSINLRLITADSSSSTSTTFPTQVPSKVSAEDSRTTPTRNLTSTVTTTSGSGSQNIHVTTGLTDTSAGALITAMQAKHRTTGSSSLRCDYPRDWKGLVHGSVGGSGSVIIRGDGLHFDRRGREDIWAWKGDDLPDVESAVVVRCDGSGTVIFGC